MRTDVELLSPVGDFECLKAAVQNGANSVYFGANLFNARAAASNFDYDGLEKVVNYCALRNVRTHLTLNILIKDSEFSDAVELAKQAYELGVDALIVQDIGLAQYLRKLFPDFPIHASTQMTIHNLEGVQELEKLGYSRAVLSRELSIAEIEFICRNSNIEIETFIHGALCISYSGQCLFSSMIGGRSGNRGKCAQPCRLPYDLIEEKNANGKITDRTIDKGYLISPRDLCSLEFLPQLIHSGVKCFKIEGRLKSPEYVATVTRIYRKYIDMVLSDSEYKVDDKDVLELKQIFNRGGFSNGHLATSANHNLVFKEKPNNMGLYVGNVAGYNKAKGHIKLLLNEKLAIGDSINFENENTKYTISEMMLNNGNVPSANIGSKVIIGRMKGNIKVGDKIYKLSSKSQLDLAQKSYSSENIKIDLNSSISIKAGEPIVMTTSIAHSKNVHLDERYKNIKIVVKSTTIPEIAVNSPITSERIVVQLSKTTDTPFNFSSINVEMTDKVFINIKVLNDLRRLTLAKLEDTIITRTKRNVGVDVVSNYLTDYSRDVTKSSSIDVSECDVKTSISRSLTGSSITNTSGHNINKKSIALYLNILNTDFDYSKLSKKYISEVYIPLRYFMRKTYEKSLAEITSNFKTYIYMPAIVKANYKNVIKHSLEDLLKQYNIAGFVVASLGDFVLLDQYVGKYEFIGNFTFNVFNMHTINTLKSLGLSKITLSPELNLSDIQEIVQSNNDFNVVKSTNTNVNLKEISNTQNTIDLELIVYGNTPVMKMNYCVLGVSNKCYPQCKMRCQTQNKYFLRDRLGFNFRILPDNVQTVTTIFNSKATCNTDIDFGINNLRIDMLDEDIDTINLIAKAALNGTKLEGKQYTRGSLNREV